MIKLNDVITSCSTRYQDQELNPASVSQSMDYDIAISYASEKREFASKIVTSLKAHQLAVFYDENFETHLWSKDLGDELHEIYNRNSKFVLLLIDEAYLKKSWTTFERTTAFERGRRENWETILIISFGELDIPGLPSSIKILRVNQESPAQIAAKVIEKVSGYQPQVEPFPCESRGQADSINEDWYASGSSQKKSWLKKLVRHLLDR